MLKFSGFADLTSCLGGWGQAPRRFPRATNTQRTQLTAHPRGVQKVARRGVPKNCRHQTPGGPKRGHRHPNAQTRTQLTQLGPPHIHGEAEQRHETKVDTEAGMLSGVSRKRSIRSNPCWFTEFCKSQCLSHFAAPFIVVRAETSIAESCEKLSSNLVAGTKRTVKDTRSWVEDIGDGNLEQD